VYGLGRRAYNNMATVNSLCNTIILSTMGIIPNKVHESLKLLYVFPALYILMQKAVIFNTLGSFWQNSEYEVPGQ
jgi:hypothetical protein